MDGTGALFTRFGDAISGFATPLLVSYPVDQVLDYRALVEFVRTRLPCDKPFILLGESFSGPVAIALAASAPGCIGLILCCSFARNPLPILRSLRHLTPFLPIVPRLTPALAPVLLGRHRLPELQDILASVAPSVMRARLRAVLTVDYSMLMSEVRVPVLYLQSIDDRIVPASSAQHLLSLCPHMSVVRLAGPHLLLQTNSQEAVEPLQIFMKTLQRTGE